MNRAREVAEDLRRGEQNARDEAVRWVMSSQSGRRLYMALLARCGVYRPSNAGDEAVYRAGRRDVGIELMAIANELCPSESLDAIREHNERYFEHQRILLAAKREDEERKDKQ